MVRGNNVVNSSRHFVVAAGLRGTRRLPRHVVHVETLESAALTRRARSEARSGSQRPHLPSTFISLPLTTYYLHNPSEGYQERILF